jgi:hypothetical protein
MAEYFILWEFGLVFWDDDWISKGTVSGFFENAEGVMEGWKHMKDFRTITLEKLNLSFKYYFKE